MFKLLFPRRVDTQDLCASRLYDNDTFYKTFISDLWCAKQRVYIESPFITTKRIKQLLPILEKLSRRGVQITINTRCPDEHDGDYIRQASSAVGIMQELGISILYTVKHHRKLAIIDDILWEGSLNILSYSDSCEMMRRIDSPTMASEMLIFTKANKYVA